jgi:hypothetical protein
MKRIRMSLGRRDLPGLDSTWKSILSIEQSDSILTWRIFRPLSWSS